MDDKSAKRILIVEDDKEILLGLSTFLKASGYLTIAAYDSVFGISLAHKEKPDMIILDLGLPGGGGFYVLNNLKSAVETNDIPILVLTAQLDPDLEERARKAGSAAYIHKPFDPPVLLSRIREILR